MTLVLFLLLLVHLGFAATVAGAATVAVTCDLFAGREQDPAWGRLAGDLLRRTLLTPATGVLAVVGLALVFFALPLAYPVPSVPVWLWGAELVLLAAGLACLYRYRSRRGREGGVGLLLTGLAGLALVTLVYAVLAGAAVLLTAPERWPVLVATPTLVLSWSGVARFLSFATLGLVLAAAGLLATAGSRSEDVGLYRSTGACLGLVALLGLPLWLLLDLVNLPLLANSLAGFALAGAMILVAAAGALVLLRVLAAGEGGARGPLVLALALLVLFVACGHVQRAAALSPLVLPAPAAGTPAGQETPLQAGTPQPERPYADAATGEDEGPLPRGREIFERVCTPCHAFERRVVGPPLAEVVPAYRGRRGALEAFLADPVGKNPDYPAMPDPGLSAEENAAVAGYLLQATGEDR